MILVTGATGFVGKELIATLLRQGEYPIRAVVRSESSIIPEAVDLAQVGDITPSTDWSLFLKDVTVIIHTAARVHMMDDHSTDPLREFRYVNSEATVNLAQQAAKAGVKRFIFFSSIKVNGEGTQLGHSYLPDDVPNPVDPYGVSKFEAEQGLLKIAETTDLEVVILRPTLVYGPGVRANFRTMIKVVNLGMPIPLGGIQNQRSLVALDNLVDLTVSCLKHP
ncbi:MAG: NAD-dependent epimerase/dehydratase family protein, partial [SAR324 cluster bacterium]|nr:NAD-dependent epimerase/dehydratase family protein [SAR324 cluster bacterium]